MRRVLVVVVVVVVVAVIRNYDGSLTAVGGRIGLSLMPGVFLPLPLLANEDILPEKVPTGRYLT